MSKKIKIVITATIILLVEVLIGVLLFLGFRSQTSRRGDFVDPLVRQEELKKKIEELTKEFDQLKQEVSKIDVKKFDSFKLDIYPQDKQNEVSGQIKQIKQQKKQDYKTDQCKKDDVNIIARLEDEKSCLEKHVSIFKQTIFDFNELVSNLDLDQQIFNFEFKSLKRDYNDVSNEFEIIKTDFNHSWFFNQTCIQKYLNESKDNVTTDLLEKKYLEIEKKVNETKKSNATNCDHKANRLLKKECWQDFNQNVANFIKSFIRSMESFGCTDDFDIRKTSLDQKNHIKKINKLSKNFDQIAKVLKANSVWNRNSHWIKEDMLTVINNFISIYNAYSELIEDKDNFSVDSKKLSNLNQTAGIIADAINVNKTYSPKDYEQKFGQEIRKIHRLIKAGFEFESKKIDNFLLEEEEKVYSSGA